MPFLEYSLRACLCPPTLLPRPHAPTLLSCNVALMLTIIALCNKLYRAKMALYEATEKVKSELDLLTDPLELNFSGLGNFSRSVLFAKVADGRSKERLVSMAGKHYIQCVSETVYAYCLLSVVWVHKCIMTYSE